MSKYIKLDDVLNIIEAERFTYRTHDLPDSASKVAIRKVREAVMKLDTVSIDINKEKPKTDCQW